MQIQKKRVIYTILYLFLSQVVVSQLSSAALPMQPDDESQSAVGHDRPIVRVLRSDEEAIVLEFSVQDFQFEEQWIDGRQLHFLSLLESGYTSQIGFPQLPVKGVLVAVPPEAEAALAVLESEEVMLDGYHISPVPQPIIEPMEDDPQIVPHEYLEYADIYFSNRFYPDKLAEIKFSGMLRDQHVVCIQFYPLRYNPLTKQLRFHRNITVQVNLTYNNQSMRSIIQPTTKEASDPFYPKSLYVDTIVNDDPKWRSKPFRQKARFLRQMAQSSAESEKYKIFIREPGVYLLDDSDLRKAGINLFALKLTNRGKEVHIEVYGSEDGRFDAGDYIAFYGTVEATDYSPYNVYWLSIGGENGLRMEKNDSSQNGTLPVPESFLDIVHAEWDGMHWATFKNSDKVDRFFWERIFAGDIVDIDVDIPYPADTGADCTVRVMLQGNTGLAHHTVIYLNGQLLDSAMWGGQTQHLAEIMTPQTLLKEGVNTLTIEMPGDVAKVDIIYFNWFEIDYHRRYITDTDYLKFRSPGGGRFRFVVEGFTQAEILVYDITNAANPKRIANPFIERVTHPRPLQGGEATYRVSFADEGNQSKTYLALTLAQTKKPVKIVKDIPSNLRSMSNGGDYIIITHSDFHQSILPLAQLREQEGMRVKVVDVADIYDEFNFGLPSDTAIRDFLQYAYHNWTPPAPFCVLLVGDATYDHKDYFGFDTQATQPKDLGDKNYVPTHLFNAPYFGDSGSDTWFVTVSGDDPLPDILIGRLPVRTRAHADAIVEKIIQYERNPTLEDWQRRVLLISDDGRIFTDSSEKLAQKIPSNYDVTKVYLSTTLPTPASRTIFDAINSGCVLVNYAGHGSWSRWAKERIFQTQDIPLLNLTNKLPFVVNVTCLSGFFSHPIGDDILGENLVRADGKGAIATLTPCGASSASWQNLFNQLVFDNLFTQRHQRLGTAIMEAKIALIAHRGGVGDSGIYNLLGDAALKLALPEISIVWDVNGDGTVDILDLVIVGSHLGIKITPFAHPNPDVNGDGVVDILDLVMVGNHFGEEYGEVQAAPPVAKHSGETATVWLEASEFSNSIVSVDVKVKEARELLGFQWNLNFDPSRLEVLRVTEGNFLEQDGETTYWHDPYIDSFSGQIKHCAAMRLTEQGISGEGVLATILFRVNTNDFDYFKNLRLTDVKLANTTGELLVFIEEPLFTSSQEKFFRK